MMLVRRVIRRTYSQHNHQASIPHQLQDQHQIPSPKGLPLVGTTLSLLAAGAAPKLHVYVDKRHRQLGKIYREKMGPVSAVFVADPADIRSVFGQEGKHPQHIIPEAWLLYNQIYDRKRGLLFMDGEEWLQLRRIMNKLLLRTETTWINSACEIVAESFVVKWKERCKNHKPYEIPDLENELYRWSLDVILAILLGSAYEKSTKHLEPLVDKISRIINSIFERSVKLQLIPASFAYKFRLPAWRNFVAAADEALDAATFIANKLLDECELGPDGLLHKLLDENLSKEDISRTITDLILAAGDTSAYAMMWTLYALSMHRDIQEKLSTSIREKTDDQLLKGVIKETLRLYPVAPFLTRIVTQDIVVGGYEIEKGTPIVMSLYSSGRDSNYFRDPEKFSPERWYRDGFIVKQNFQNPIFPFAMGARSCIGRKIAEAQMNITVAKIVENFSVTLLNDKPIDIVLKMIAVPSQRLRIQLDPI